ncbi:universal stress protein [Streptomyces sparsus]
MPAQTLTRPRPTTDAPLLPVSLPRPVTALVADRSDDLAVVEAAVRLAAARKAPLLLVAVLPARQRLTGSSHEDAKAARTVLAPVLSPLRRAGVGYIPVVHRLPADGGQSQQRAADEVLALASRHRSPLLVASSRGPVGLDAHSLIEASDLHGGPAVHAVAPCLPAAPLDDAGPRPVEVSPTEV